MYEITINKSDISQIPDHVSKVQVDLISEYLKVCKYKRLENYQRDRNLLIHNLMWETGGRVDDICHLDNRMIKWNEQLIRLWTKKRKKEVYIQMSKPIMFDLMNYKANYNKTERMWDITRQRVWQMVCGWSNACGFKAHPHMYRHGNAIFLMEKHMPTALISARLGHANTSITQSLYQKVTPQLQKELMKDVVF